MLPALVPLTMNLLVRTFWRLSWARLGLGLGLGTGHVSGLARSKLLTGLYSNSLSLEQNGR